MKRRFLLSLWLLVPVVLVAWHYGPGQRGLARDQAAERLAVARVCEAGEDWSGALDAYDAVLRSLPATDTAARLRVQLARAKVRIPLGDLPEALEDLEALLPEAAKSDSPELARETRANLATARYYAAWLMRLELAPTEEWMAQAEGARQHFRLLAEEATGSNPQLALDHQKNLEAVVRLERMDLSELESLPLPKKCSGCKNCSQKCRGQKESRNPQPQEKPKDARGAGVGQRPPGGS